MSTHTYRDKAHVLMPREAIRAWLPIGKLGFSIEDLDASLRLFNQRFDPVGSFRLCEHKIGTDDIGWSKEWHFAMYDTLFRKSDPTMKLYKGYYVINTETDDWMQCECFRVNKVELSQGEFRRWLWADSLDHWLSVTGPIDDRGVLEGVRLAHEASIFDLVDVPPYQFKTWISAKIRAELTHEATDGR